MRIKKHKNIYQLAKYSGNHMFIKLIFSIPQYLFFLKIFFFIFLSNFLFNFMIRLPMLFGEFVFIRLAVGQRRQKKEKMCPCFFLSFQTFLYLANAIDIYWHLLCQKSVTNSFGHVITEICSDCQNSNPACQIMTLITGSY